MTQERNKESNIEKLNKLRHHPFCIYKYQQYIEVNGLYEWTCRCTLYKEFDAWNTRTPLISREKLAKKIENIIVDKINFLRYASWLTDKQFFQVRSMILDEGKLFDAILKAMEEK